MKVNCIVAKQLSKLCFYIMLFVVFTTLFTLIIPYYLNVPSSTAEPIDAHATSFKYFFDSDYVEAAKETGYNKRGYFKTFLPLDLIFPVIYTSMFLVPLQFFRKQMFRNVIRWMVIAGCICDYLENISFSVFLLSTIDLAGTVAFFTTIKTCLFILNIFIFLLGLVRPILLLFKKR